ncbi:MAG: thiamine-phosphate kinase [Candidatus Bathyarchaeota archaeon]|nr:thiamine-phosphate kinase [Candidatus Bathyarchaeota archaeon]
MVSLITAAELGERQIIKLLTNRFRKTPQMAVPFGDDVAGIFINSKQIAILKTDTLVGTTDIPPTMTLRHAARKAVVMNVSDFASKGVHPSALLVSLTIPRHYSKSDIEEISIGLEAAAREYDTYIIGGDTGEGNDLIISLMVFGITSPSSLVLRKGAQIDDIIAVTGMFGKTSAGLHILLHDLQITESWKKPLIDSVLMPKARLQEGKALVKKKLITSSIDSSDGLAISLHELKNNSGLGMAITDIPIAEEVLSFSNKYEMNPEEFALFGGEEYELVVTIRPENWVQANDIVIACGGRLIPIGKVIKESKVTLTTNHVVRDIPVRGWEHFKGS